MGKLLVFLLFLGAGIGIYKIYRDHQEKLHVERNDWPARLAPVFKHHTASYVLNGGVDGGEHTFFKLLYMTNGISKDGYPLIETLTRGAAQAGASGVEAPLLAASVLENFKRATDLKLFNDPGNLIRMERGEYPVSKATGWEEEPVTVGYIVTPTLGRELRLLLPNMVVMPEPVRNAQTEVTTQEAARLYNQWLVCKMIAPETANAIKEKVRQDAEQR